MILTHLSLTNFRNFARLDIDIPAGQFYCGGERAGENQLAGSGVLPGYLFFFHATTIASWSILLRS